MRTALGRWWLLALLATGSMDVVHAQDTSRSSPSAAAPSTPPRARIDPAVRAQLTRRGRAEALLALAGDAAVAIAELERAGIEVQRMGDRPAARDGIVAVHLRPPDLAVLAGNPRVRAVWAGIDDAAPMLSTSAELLGLAQGGGRPRYGLDGEGMLIATADSLIDVFHPVFFHADGGAHEWIDLDGDDLLTPGVDGVEVDGVLHVLQPVIAHRLWGMADVERELQWDPGLDWLFVDLDEDGVRDYGSAHGFSESTPAYGEPLFVPDDLDGDGALGRSERILRLRTSKFRSVFVVDASLTGRVYARGVDLIEVPARLPGSDWTFSPVHATAVLSIAAGGVPLSGRRDVGVAPAADLIATNLTSGSSLGAVMWAIDQEPDVMVHSWSTGGSVGPVDGSDAASLLLDRSASRTVHVCSAGNTGDDVAHGMATTADGEAVLPLRIWGTVTAIELGIQSAEGRITAVTVESPGGARHEHSLSGPDTVGPLRLVSAGSTERGTSTVYLDLRGEGGALATGTWRLLAHGDTEGARVHAYLRPVGGSGAVFDAEAVSEMTTLGAPGTADACITVGAVAAHARREGPWFGSTDEGANELRAYSGRGPRLDGLPKPDVVAPDNPWVATPAGLVAGLGDTPFASFRVFGGTSGAAPHVAGLAALLLQAGAGDVAADLRDGATGDGIGVALPDPGYGHGRAHLPGALGRDETGVPPVIHLEADRTVLAVGEEVTLVVVVDDPGATGPIRVRWDIGYDGTWDGPAHGVGNVPLAWRPTAAGPAAHKVRVLNGAGLIAEAAIRWTVTDAAPETSMPAVGPGTGCAASGTPTLPTVLLGMLIAAGARPWLRRRRRRALDRQDARQADQARRARATRSASAPIGTRTIAMDGSPSGWATAPRPKPSGTRTADARRSRPMARPPSSRAASIGTPAAP